MLPELHALGDRIVARFTGDAVRSLVAPLKGEPRAVLKALEKYSGDHSRLTDLARKTFECGTLGDSLQVLELLAADEQFQIVLIKNRV